MVNSDLNISVVILSVCGLNVPVKRHRLSDWENPIYDAYKKYLKYMIQKCWK